MKLLQKLWADDAGFIISAELVLVATIVVIGLICGLVSIRNQVCQKLVDVGQAIGQLSQSYSFTGCGIAHDGHNICFVDGSFFCDARDVCQDDPCQPQPCHRGLQCGQWGGQKAPGAAPGELGF